jgi:hypothetical protein
VGADYSSSTSTSVGSKIEAVPLERTRPYTLHQSPVFPVSFREQFATLDRMLSSMPSFRVSTSPEVRRIASEKSI